MNRNKETLTGRPIYVERREGTTQVEVALQYNDTYTENVLSFANNINTVDGGTHVTGFRAALTSSLNDWARKNSVLKEADGNLSGDDVREGLTAVISVKLVEPQFEGQTKAKLGNADVKGHVQAAVSDGLTQYLEENPGDGRKIIEKCLTASRAREAARKARMWSWGWTATHLGMSAIQLATMPLFPKQTYIDRYVGAVSKRAKLDEKKFRSLFPGFVYIRIMQAMGADAQQIKFSELYVALQQGVVDGQENPLTNISSAKLYEVQKYVSLTSHMWSGYNLLANLKTWRALPEDVRTIVERNAVAYVRRQRADNSALNASLQDALAKRGMVFNTADTSGFRAPLADFYRRWKDHFGAKAWSLLEGHVGKLG